MAFSFKNLKARASRTIKRGHKLAKRLDKTLAVRKGCCVRHHGVTRGCYKTCAHAMRAAKHLGPTASVCARGGRGPCREQTSYKKSKIRTKSSRGFSVAPRVWR